MISGGETTVTIRGQGLGGRNQEFALAAAIDIAGIGGTVILSAGTDGTDGPTDAAGAIVDGATLARAQARPERGRVPNEQRFVSFFRSHRRSDQDRPYRH